MEKNIFANNTLTNSALKSGAMSLRAVNHKTRHQMLQLLNDQRRMTVTEIYVKLELEQSVASQHLAILRRAGVLKSEREGKLMFYSINYNNIAKLANAAIKIGAVN